MSSIFLLQLSLGGFLLLSSWFTLFILVLELQGDRRVTQGVPKTLLTLHLVDSSGKLDVRSWNHTPDMFNHLANCPILIRRVRVTSFASIKLCELLDGSGSVVEKSFPGDAVLRKFWSE